MPKNVDHQQRRDDIAQATFELIARNGLMNASVRAVADYSGYSAIAQDEKLTVRQRVEQACEQLLPLDAMRKREIVAYAELGRLERARPTGRLEEGQEIAKVCEASLEALDVHRVLDKARRAQLARRLHWVLDGLAAQEIIYPSYINPADIQEELRQTLDDIEREIADLIPQK